MLDHYATTEHFVFYPPCFTIVQGYYHDRWFRLCWFITYKSWDDLNVVQVLWTNFWCLLLGYSVKNQHGPDGYFEEEREDYYQKNHQSRMFLREKEWRVGRGLFIQNTEYDRKNVFKHEEMTQKWHLVKSWVCGCKGVNKFDSLWEASPAKTAGVPEASAHCQD